MRRISWEQYYDKVLGGWIGKSLGGTIGRFEGTKEITHFNIYELLPNGMIANDDLDIQLVWLDVLLDKGIYFTSEHLMQAWIAEYDYNFGEYGFARRNYLRGLKPPVSGWFANHYYITGMGCPIRSEVWGLICPGNPDLAAQYAYKDGILDHSGESVWAEQFLSAMEAEAFFESDITKLIQLGLKYVPKNSKLYQCIQKAIDCFNRGLSWEDTWKQLIYHHSHPDCTYAPVNLGIIVMALLYGGGDFDKTLTIAVNSGWDVDCTCSSTAALLGIIFGKSGFAPHWLEYIGDEVITLARPVHPMGSMQGITLYACRAGVTIQREGMTPVVISDVPAELELLPAVKYAAGVVLDVEYNGNPVIGVGDTRTLMLQVRNQESNTHRGMLTLDIPEGWICGNLPKQLVLEPYEEIMVPVQLTVPESIKIMYDTNLLTAIFSDVTGTQYSHTFGLCGAPVVRVMGPFFDAYKDWLDKKALPSHRLLTTPSEEVIIPEAGEEWGNHRVDIHKEYICEDFSNLLSSAECFLDGVSVNIYEDLYAAKDVFGLQGPCCLYYYEEIFSREARKAHIFIGSSDPCKVWWNGTLCHVQQDCRFWYSNNQVIEVDLQEGKNVLILKTLRCGNDNRLSLVFRHKPVLWGYDSCAFITDLSYNTLNHMK